LRQRSSRGEGARGLFADDRGGDPGAAFLGLLHREHAHLAGEQETQRVDCVPHPAGVGDDGDALPLRQVIDRDVKIVPTGAWKARADFVVQPNLAVPLERSLHRRFQDGVAFLVGDPPFGEDTDDVVGQLLDDLDHRGFQLVP